MDRSIVVRAVGRRRCLPWIAGSVLLLAACSRAGVHTAEILSTPFPGAVLRARPDHGPCIDRGCPASYRVQITNPTDGGANVQECSMVDPPHLLLRAGYIAGTYVRAHGTRSVGIHVVLPLTKEEIPTLTGARLTCTGLDWHGNAPI